MAESRSKTPSGTQSDQRYCKSNLPRSTRAVASDSTGVPADPQRNARSARILSIVPHRMTAEERHFRISELAYLKAAARGFAPEGALADWLEAEQEVDAIAGISRGG